MTLKQKIVGVIVAVLALLGFSTDTFSLGGISTSSSDFYEIGGMGTSTARLVTTTSSQVMATSSSRESAKISNVSSVAIYCNADGDKAAVGYSGIMIAASSTLLIDSDFPYTGAIRCISPLGNASTTVYSAR